MVSSDNDSERGVDAEERRGSRPRKTPRSRAGEKTSASPTKMTTASPTTTAESVELSTERPLFLTATELRQVEADPYLSVSDVVADPRGGGGE